MTLIGSPAFHLRPLALLILWLSVVPLLRAQSVGNSNSAGPVRDSSQPSAELHDLVFVRGPASAPITIVEFSDFECPFCGREAPVLEALQQRYPNDIRLIFKHNPLPIHSHARLAHEAAIAAAFQGKFWEMQDLLFRNQGHLSLLDLVRYATLLKLDSASFRRQLETHAFAPVVDRDLAEASGFGISATPTFFVNGKKVIGTHTLPQWQEVIDQELGISHPKIKPQDLQLTGAPVRGAQSAPITIVEFSDFQCPFCARALPIVKQVLDAYPGQVRWIFKNYPLDFHTASPLAHRAAIAAHQQGKFWEMHDLLFGNQHALGREDLLRYARQLNLDMERFQADLDNDQSAKALESDRREAEQLGVSGTPTFFVQGEMLVGAQSVDAFSKMIDPMLPASARVQGKTLPSAPTVASAQPPTASPTSPRIGPARVTVRSIEKSAAPAPIRDEGASSLGKSDAAVTVSWFADLQSPLTLKANELIHQLLQEYPGQLRVVFKHRPLEFHRDAILAHTAVVAAGEQGKFWEMEEIILKHQQAIQRANLLEYATQIGLDPKKFESAIGEQRHPSVIDADLAEARYRDIRGTPVFFVNGNRVDGLQSLQMFKSYIDTELRSPRSSAISIVSSSQPGTTPP